MMLGFLLARAGVEVVVLEKHADFLRDFRGDTVHPSTLEVMHELGLLEDFLKLPHQEVSRLGGQIGNEFVQLADFSHLATVCKFIALVPQWDFLDFLTERARRYPAFKLIMQAEVVDLLTREGRIAGVIAETPDGSIEVRANLTVGADGRGSIVRDRAGLDVQNFGAPMDVLWFRMSRKPSDGEQTLGRIIAGKMMVMLNRGDYWQCGYLIRKGEFENIRQRGIEQFREDLVSRAVFARPHGGATGLGAAQVAEGQNRSIAEVVPTRTAVHRRRRARHVTHRGCRNQPGDPGCGCGCEHSR
jgi:2-polyprenyl-6-methoxyphenol hydroxylase-like FAD-dependent oxidoreductase